MAHCELELIRKTFTKLSTIGELYMNGKFYCHTLEDVDRDLIQTMPLADIQQIKVQNNTCIPYGKYDIIINISNRFKRVMPLLLLVPGFEGIRIHNGNTDADTEGCILVGNYNVLKPNWVSNSKLTFTKLLPELQKYSSISINIIKFNPIISV